MTDFEEFSFEKVVEKEELKKLTDLAHQIWPPTFAQILSTDQINYMLNWMYAPEKLEKQQTEGHRFYFLKHHQMPIGFVGLQPNYPQQGFMRIHKIYLLPDFQGKRLGYYMMNKIEELAEQEELHSLHLNVNRYNQAKDFYLKLGFEITKEEDIDIGKGYWMEDFVMVKKLGGVHT